jgi:hypothetical protein
MSIGWRVSIEVPEQPGSVSVQHFLVHCEDPKMAEFEVRKFKSAPDDCKTRAYLPIAGEELADRKIVDGEVRSIGF